MRRALPFIYGLFTLSGFVGLIYESLLSRYMKLFLGHSSYGQIFTLVTFMGGLGLGAFLAARHSQRFRNPFLVYAVIEILIALFALAFHQLFLWTTEGYFLIAGDLSAVPYAPLVVRVLFCLLLTLPLSTLLGTTFPIAAAGVMRLTGDAGKRSLSILYFTNSIGAAAGILCTSYFFLKQFGTTGTLQLASLGNLTVAFGFLAVALLIGVTGLAQRPATASFTSEAHSEWWGVNKGEIRLWLFVALGTGLASFIYEVGWIRLLSLMMGSSTHSFDIMVSAFIFGLAFGGLYALHLMNRANADIPRTMAYVQIAMGLLALSSLFTYRLFFNAVDASHSILMRNEDAYLTYSVFKYLLALGLMLPASFCAGMTLPMITHYLVQKTGSEQFTGLVYGWNTLGAICGAMAGGIFLLPALQLEGTILAGALLDAAIGLVILYFLPRRIPVKLIATAVVVIVAIPAFNQKFDLARITAGQFRAYNTSAPPVTAIQHGRTATISVHKRADGLVSLITNGKSDGAIQAAPAVGVCGVGDESTVAQLALLPMMTRGDQYNAAMIGLGTGMTLHYLLGDSLLDAVDLIEIEEAVPKLAEHFRPRNERAYTDPRVNLIIDDAKSYFYSNRKKYDLIISEPSNPWVSGVSSLFTKEFYRHTQQFLKPGGMLVQWIQSYEFSDPLMLSVLSALNEFAYFEIYSIPNSADLMILASDFPISFAGMPRLRKMTTTQADIQMLGCSLEDLGPANYIVSSKTLKPLLESVVWKTAANSDYKPYVDQNAELAFYTRSNVELFRIFNSGISRYQELFEPDRYAHTRTFRPAQALPTWSQIPKGSLLKAVLHNLEPSSDWIAAENLLLEATGPYLGTPQWLELEPVQDFYSAVDAGGAPEEISVRYQLIRGIMQRDSTDLDLGPFLEQEVQRVERVPTTAFWLRSLAVTCVRNGRYDLLQRLVDHAIVPTDQINVAERFLLANLRAYYAALPQETPPSLVLNTPPPEDAP